MLEEIVEKDLTEMIEVLSCIKLVNLFEKIVDLHPKIDPAHCLKLNIIQSS